MTSPATLTDAPAPLIYGRVAASWHTAHRASLTAVVPAELTLTDADTGEPIASATSATIRFDAGERHSYVLVETTELLNPDGHPARGREEATGESTKRRYVLVHGDPPDLPARREDVEDLDFGRALAALRSGRRVTRAGWNGAGQWLLLVPGSTIHVEAGRPLGRAAPELVGTELRYQAHIDMKTADGTLVPWLATQTDLLAYDWRLVVEPEVAR